MFRRVSRRGTPIALQQAPSVPPRTIVAARGCLRGQLPPRETSAAFFCNLRLSAGNLQSYY
jgi:hypothetical protein